MNQKEINAKFEALEETIAAQQQIIDELTGKLNQATSLTINAQDAPAKKLEPGKFKGPDGKNYVFNSPKVRMTSATRGNIFIPTAEAVKDEVLITEIFENYPGLFSPAK